MLTIAISGDEALAERLRILPDALRAALAERIEAQRQALASQVVDVNLSGGVLQARSGRLRESISSEIVAQDDAIAAQVFSDGDVPHAAIQEFGGKTAAHDIFPDKAKVLAFVFAGKKIFARHVRHPGSQIPERSYLRSALDDQGEDIATEIADTVSGLAETVKDTE